MQIFTTLVEFKEKIRKYTNKHLFYLVVFCIYVYVWMCVCEYAKHLRFLCTAFSLHFLLLPGVFYGAELWALGCVHT